VKVSGPLAGVGAVAAGAGGGGGSGCAGAGAGDGGAVTAGADRGCESRAGAVGALRRRVTDGRDAGGAAVAGVEVDSTAAAGGGLGTEAGGSVGAAGGGCCVAAGGGSGAALFAATCAVPTLVSTGLVFHQYAPTRAAAAIRTSDAAASARSADFLGAIGDQTRADAHDGGPGRHGAQRDGGYCCTSATDVCTGSGCSYAGSFRSISARIGRMNEKR
jgi:hypothetical protein